MSVSDFVTAVGLIQDILPLVEHSWFSVAGIDSQDAAGRLRALSADLSIINDLKFDSTPNSRLNRELYELAALCRSKIGHLREITKNFQRVSSVTAPPGNERADEAQMVGLAQVQAEMQLLNSIEDIQTLINAAKRRVSSLSCGFPVSKDWDPNFCTSGARPYPQSLEPRDVR